MLNHKILVWGAKSKSLILFNMIKNYLSDLSSFKILQSNSGLNL